ncbi:hypothetical protein [Romboutsia sp.]|uniref:hypothetical protein n=1 Tax=Romboutsia sp. TaxID=1965302 RepID=UPI003F3BC8D7
MKRISLGTSDFKKIIDDNKYFVDKSLIIKDFLEKTQEDASYLFEGLKIEK